MNSMDELTSVCAGINCLAGTVVTQQGGTLTLQDLDTLFVSLWESARASPDYLIISPTMKRRLLHLQRMARLYEVTLPRTRRKLRTCVERKAQARLAQGKHRIARIEQRELREEQAVLRGDL